MRFCFDTELVTWFGEQIDMKPVNYFNQETRVQEDELYLNWLDKISAMMDKDMEDAELFSGGNETGMKGCA